MTFNEWGIVASIIGAAIGVSALLQAWLLGRVAQAFHGDVHTATQRTLTDLAKGFRESQERMDQRWQEAFERMDQRADERHREVLQALQALKG
jgi:hypothetical protein